MTETQREAVPFIDTGERGTALAFLSFARHCALKKTEGLDEDQLRRVLVPSGTSLLGLVQHLTVGERWWFVHHFDGSTDDEEWDFGMDVPATTPAADRIEPVSRRPGRTAPSGTRARRPGPGRGAAASAGCA